MSSGERPMGAAKCKQPDAEALCHRRHGRALAALVALQESKDLVLMYLLNRRRQLGFDQVSDHRKSPGRTSPNIEELSPKALHQLARRRAKVRFEAGEAARATASQSP